MIEKGMNFTSTLTVSESMTAIAMGSGDLPVLSTPQMIALMENAAMLAVADALDSKDTTVGAHMASSHMAPSKVGDTIAAYAEVTDTDQRRIEFQVRAMCGDTILGEGRHIRYVVDRERFLARLNGK